MTRKIIAVVVALAASVPASAGNLMLGPAKVHPFYGFETRYEDNIYRVPRDINHYAVSGGGVRGSWIFANDLGVAAELPFASNQKLNLGYGATFENYTTQSSANNAINQRVDAAYEFKGSKTKASAFEHYVNTHDPQFNPNGTVVNGALITREARWGNDAGVNGEYFLGDKFFAGADFDSAVTRYLDRSGGSASLANLLNTSVVTFGVKGGYLLAPKTRAFAAVHRSITHYTEHTRADNHRDTNVDFGVEGELTAKLKGLVQTGFIYQGYDQDASNPARASSARHWSFLASLDYKPTERDQFVLTANRATADAATSGSRYYVTGGFNLGYNRKITDKITAGVNGGAQWDRYSDNFTVGTVTKSRRDDSYQAGARADYKVNDWLTAGATYRHNARFSSFSREFDYQDNITGVNAKLMF